MNMSGDPGMTLKVWKASRCPSMGTAVTHSANQLLRVFQVSVLLGCQNHLEEGCWIKHN